MLACHWLVGGNERINCEWVVFRTPFKGKRGRERRITDHSDTAMGFLCSTSANNASADIDPALVRRSKERSRSMGKEASILNQKKKLLLLGAGESGKSTVFKQMRIINASGYSPGELKQFKYIIHKNIIDGIKTLIEAATERELEFLESNEDNADSMLLFDGDTIGPEVGQRLVNLWTDPAIQEAFRRRAEFQLSDSVGYFMGHLERVCTSDYLPSVDDALHARVRTSGVVSRDFDIKGQAFQMFDVGGQRSERRNWLPLFDHVTAIVFVAAISEYNQVVPEDRSKNRVTEALELFEQIVNSKHFEGIDVILFLNKSDLFAEKIKTVDPVTWFPDYTGGCDYERAEAYFKKAFEKRIADKKKQLYSYTTCATDTQNISVVFSAVQGIIMKNVANSDGLGANFM